MSHIFWASFGVIFVLALLAAWLGIRLMEKRRRAQRSGRLEMAGGALALPHTDVLVEQSDSTEAALARLLQRFNLLEQWRTKLQQSGLDWTFSRLLITMGAGVATGAIAGWQYPFLFYRAVSAAGLAVALGLAPWIFVARKRNQRIAAFEEQFPEALDFVARSLRSGHAFSVSLEMLSAESPEPLRSEFRRIFNEQNLGESIPVVLRHFADRLPLVDVRFFVSAVLMQRETGGNLAEILSRLSYVIRERFRLRGQVKAASAHGRITALILTLLPVGTIMTLTVVAPGYLPSMAETPTGRIMILIALAGQLIGYVAMRHIINIKV